MEVFHYYPWLFPVLAFIFSLLIGSFLNVVIHRLPIMMEREWQQECSESFPDYKIPMPKGTYNLSVPRSTCPKCETQIRAIDNIPVLSWLFLKGKCRKCSNPISPRYPFVELLTAVMCGFVAVHFGFSYYAIALIFFTFALIAATFIDLDTMLLPDQITLPLVWSGIALALFGISPISLQDSVIGAMAGYLALWSVYWLFKLLTGKEGMGYGDFKLLAALRGLAWLATPTDDHIALFTCRSCVWFNSAAIETARHRQSLPFWSLPRYCRLDKFDLGREHYGLVFYFGFRNLIYGDHYWPHWRHC